LESLFAQLIFEASWRVARDNDNDCV